MKTILIAIALILVTNLSYAYVVVCDKTTNKIIEISNSNVSRFSLEYYYVFMVKKFPSGELNLLRGDPKTNTLVKKSQEVVDLEANAKRKLEIRTEIRKLTQQFVDAMNEWSIFEGSFDVSIETNTISNKVIELKTEYNNLD